MQGSHMVLHCGASHATREQVLAVEVPEHTKTWFPLGYKRMLEITESAAKRHHLELRKEAFGLSKDGGQFFGLLQYDSGHPDLYMAQGLRGSIDMSMANAGASGAGVFVCDNMAFNADGLKILRRNTRYVEQDFEELIEMQFNQATGLFEQLKQSFEIYKQVEVDKDTGFEMLGLMMGRKLLSPTQATIAFDDWTTPRHVEFADPTMYSLYNCVTEALKKSAPGKIIDKHVAAHEFFEAQLEDEEVEA